MNRLFDNILMWFAGFIMVLFLVTCTIYLPYLMHAEKTCLEKGYAETRITYDFDIYCATLDGSVTIKVDKQ